MPGSVEELLHESGKDAFVVPMPTDQRKGGRTHCRPFGSGRAIGVIYQPATERQSHYFHVRPADQFDAMIHIDKTRALEPLETTSVWIAGETPGDLSQRSLVRINERS